jgi:hypothetical protein
VPSCLWRAPANWRLWVSARLVLCVASLGVRQVQVSPVSASYGSGACDARLTHACTQLEPGLAGRVQTHHDRTSPPHLGCLLGLIVTLHSTRTCLPCRFFSCTHLASRLSSTKRARCSSRATAVRCVYWLRGWLIKGWRVQLSKSRTRCGRTHTNARSCPSSFACPPRSHSKCACMRGLPWHPMLTPVVYSITHLEGESIILHQLSASFIELAAP